MSEQKKAPTSQREQLKIPYSTLYRINSCIRVRNLPDANDSNVGDHVPTAVLDALQNFPTFPTLAKSISIYVLVEQRFERLKKKKSDS